MCAQLGTHYLIGVSLGSLWEYIHSIQLLASLPVLTVTMPGQVNYFLEKLQTLASFNFIKLSHFVSLDFQWTNILPEKVSFSRIGFKDRVFMHALPPAILAIALFLGYLLLITMISCFPDNRLANKALKTLKMKSTPKRYLFLRFMVTMYLPLLCACLINTEN